MRAAVLEGPDGIPTCGDFADPVVTEGRQEVTMVAAGLHPVVRSLAGGGHYGSERSWPMVPGVDAVARDADGRLVYTGFAEHPYGTFAERISVPMVLPLPAGADPVQVAGGLNPGLSSWLPLKGAAAAGLSTVLVLGATGVAGQLAVQNALALGATRVIAAGRNREQLTAVADGHPVTPVELVGELAADTTTLAAAFAEYRPALVLDFLWGQPAEATFQALARSELGEDTRPVEYVEIGQAAGATAALPASLLRSTAITVRGSGAGSSSMAEVMAELPRYLERIADGSVRVPVEEFPLDRVAQAWQASTPGRRVVITGPAD